MKARPSLVPAHLIPLELDNPKLLNGPRIVRVARGSGTSVREVNELLMQYKQFEKVVGKMKGFKPGRGGAANMQQLQSMVPPQLLKQMGGAGGLQQLMRQMDKGFH